MAKACRGTALGGRISDVATHICDSVKRRLKEDGTPGVQGEFGIGLLSFWTVGDEPA